MSAPEQALPSVMVVVPCYNYARYLTECVESVLMQEGVSLEVLIIDDASTDDSAAVARALGARDPRIRVVVHAQNAGHIATYNEGLSSATSDYVVLLSADDMLAPGALGRATRIMEKHPDVGLVYGHPQVFENGPVQTRTHLPWRSIWRGRRWIRLQFRRGMSIIYSPEAVVRTSVHRQVGWYDPQLPHSGDLEMWLRIAAVSSVARVNGPDQAYRRVHSSSMMQTRFASPIVDLAERQRAYESFLARCARSPRETRSLERIMRKRLADEALGWAASGTLGTTSREQVAEAVDFARAVDPSCDRRIYGRALAAREANRRSVLGQFWIGLGLVAMAFTSRFRWHRWRQLGV